MQTLRFLLLQVRKPHDPMRRHEIASFVRALRCDEEQIAAVDLLAGQVGKAELDRGDVVLLGGSGDYSAAGEGDWLERILDLLREVHQQAKPTFASCWGFQAMARALGGRVIHDLTRAELGTIKLHLTDAGRNDPVFGPLGSPFLGQAGHEDCVVELPPDAVRLASSERTLNQAYRFDGRPIYCTQFHPELNRDDLLARVQAYPWYVEKIAGVPLESLLPALHDTPETEALLRRFLHVELGIDEPADAR